MATKSSNKSPASQGKSGQSFVNKQSSAPGKGGLNVTRVSKSPPTAQNIMSGKGPMSGPRVTVVNKGGTPSPSAAALLRGGYGAYQSPAVNKPKAYAGPIHRVLSPLGPETNGLASYEGLSRTVNRAGPRLSNIIAGDVAKYPVDGQRLNPMGEMFRAAVDRNPADAPMAIASYAPRKSYDRVPSFDGGPMIAGGPLKGSSWQGKVAAAPAPMISPMAGQGTIGKPGAANLASLYRKPETAIASRSPMSGQGVPGFGGMSPFAGKFDVSGLRSAYDRFAVANTVMPTGSNSETLGDNYQTGNLGPQSGPETMPDPVSGPSPAQRYNVAEAIFSNVNPAQERSPVPGFMEKIPGPIGAIAGGVNWLSNLPGDGAKGMFGGNGSGGSGLWDGGGGGIQDTKPTTATGAVNPVAAAAAKPAGMVYPRFMYPEYTQGWAGLPRGFYGRG